MNQTISIYHRLVARVGEDDAYYKAPQTHRARSYAKQQQVPPSVADAVIQWRNGRHNFARELRDSIMEYATENNITDWCYDQLAPLVEID